MITYVDIDVSEEYIATIWFFFFLRERGYLIVYHQICVIYYVPSIHKMHQDKMQ